MFLPPNLFALSTNVWPRVAQLGNSPTLLALALLLDGIVALAAGSLRPQKENLA